MSVWVHWRISLLPFFIIFSCVTYVYLSIHYFICPRFDIAASDYSFPFVTDFLGYAGTVTDPH
jgi:hypothetical protein